MGERLVPAQSRSLLARRLLPEGRRLLGAFAVVVALLGIVVGSPGVAHSQADDDQDADTVSSEDDETDAEELPPIDLDVPRTGEDLDLGPAAPAPQTLASGDLSNARLIDLIPNPELVHPDLPAGIVVDPTSLGPIAAEINEARADLADARNRSETAGSRFELASVRLSLVDDQLDAAIESTQHTAMARVDATDDLTDYAIAAFLNSGDLESLVFSNDLDSMSLVTIASQTEEHLSETMLGAIDEANSADAVLTELRNGRIVEQSNRNVAIEDRETAVADISDAEERIVTLGPELETSILQLEVSGTDMPLVVLDAYYRAADNFRINRPACRVSWHQLAGIGRVESVHGTFGGNVVGRDGRTSGEILGPVLDGDPWLAIADSDGGEYDLNTEWDRAVGPMQFIPTSWARHGLDGNDDGVIDPHNLYDAALAAASHLCGSASNLDQRANYQRALLGYNRSVTYGLDVMGYADRYFAALELGPNL